MSQAALKLSDYLPAELPAAAQIMPESHLSADDRQMMGILAEARSATHAAKAMRREIENGFERLIAAARARQPLGTRVREMRENLPDLMHICGRWEAVLRSHAELTLIGLKVSRKAVLKARRDGDRRHLLQMEEYLRSLQLRLSEIRGLQASVQRLVRGYKDMIARGDAELPHPEPLLARPQAVADTVALHRSVMKRIPRARAYLAK